MAINLDDLKKLSPKMKALIVCLVVILLGYFYYMFFLQAALTKHAALSTKLAELQKEVSEKEKAVAQIDRYIREISELKVAFKTALLKLPNATEIPELLAAVSSAGKAAGLDFLRFEPKIPEKKPEVPAAKPGAPAPAPPPKPADAKGQPPAEPEKFYEDIPIKVQLAGRFHNILSFFDKVARLPRIVNIEDIVMLEPQEVKGRGRVVKTFCTVKTYMFVEKK